MFSLKLSYIDIKNAQLLMTPAEDESFGDYGSKFEFKKGKTVTLYIDGKAVAQNGMVRLASANINGNQLRVNAKISNGRATGLTAHFGNRYLNLAGVDMFVNRLVTYNDAQGQQHLGLIARDQNGNYIGTTNLYKRLIINSKGQPIKKQETPQPPQAKNIQGMPQNFTQNKANVATLQQYLVRMGEQQSISTKKAPTGVDGLYGPKTEAAAQRVMKNQGWTWDQLWAQAVQYAKQIQGQQSQTQGQANQELAQVNSEAAEFANPQKLTAQTQGITQQAQPASASQYAANASNVLQTKPADASAVKPKVMTESAEEVKEKFYDIFNRMNNATILQ